MIRLYWLDLGHVLKRGDDLLYLASIDANLGSKEFFNHLWRVLYMRSYLVPDFVDDESDSTVGEAVQTPRAPLPPCFIQPPRWRIMTMRRRSGQEEG
jgi:hypothetical protein